MKQDLSELCEMVPFLRRINNTINQLTERMNETVRICATDIRIYFRIKSGCSRWQWYTYPLRRDKMMTIYYLLGSLWLS